MKFLADAHVSHELVAAIRSWGHDCTDASSIPLRMQDVDVLRLAAAESRVVITADKDFGELVFVHGIATPGVILLRLALATETQRVAYVQSIWPILLGRLPNAFITVSTSGIRARPIVE